MFYLSMLIVTLSIVFYQVLQKGVSNNVNPFISLIITYAVAILLSFVLYFVFPSKINFLESFKHANYASYLLGITIVGIEIGYLFVYRSGWDFSIANPFSSTVTNVIIMLIGIFFFKEYLTGLRLLGIVLCMIGGILINTK